MSIDAIASILVCSGVYLDVPIYWVCMGYLHRNYRKSGDAGTYAVYGIPLSRINGSFERHRIL